MSEPTKKLSTESYKGVRDFYPEDMFIENYIFSVWRKVAESFGYGEYNASILEPSELYRAKSSEEIVNDQTYTFIDRGDREVTLRPEMTPTVARMVAARRRDLSFPLRWYSIPNLFRYERPQRGRLREHFQLNVDIFGVGNSEAEVEIISLAHSILKAFRLEDSQFIIKVNDKAHVRKALESIGLSGDQVKQATMLLDKREKMDTFESEWETLTGKTFDFKMFENPALDSFVSLLKERGISNVEAAPGLVRGFEYYSGIVFEIFDTNPQNSRSIMGGGRYDNLVSLFDQDNVPAVGFGMGDVTIRDVLETYGLLPAYHSSTHLYLCLLDASYAKAAEALAAELRKNGLNVSIDLSGKKIGDQIKKADKDKVPFIAVIGEEEIASKTFKVKDLSKGDETSLPASEIAKFILSRIPLV